MTNTLLAAASLAIPETPRNMPAEQALLGALLINNKALEQVVEFLEPHHFSEKVHGDIYHAIRAMISKVRIADPITLGQYFMQSQIDIANEDYLKELVNAVITTVNPRDYGRIIYEAFLRRELIDLGQTIVQEAHEPRIDKPVNCTIEEAEQKLYNLVTVGYGSKEIVTFNQALTTALTTVEAACKSKGMVGITTGFTEINQKLGGLHPSDLIIIAGRPSMGKTTLGTNIAFNAAKAQLTSTNGGAVLFFSLEMSSDQLAARILASETRISSDKIRRGELTVEDFVKITKVAKEIGSLPLYIDDTAGLSLANIRNRARRVKRQHQIKLIVIDYLQLMTSGQSKYENRVQEISEITRGLKTLAKELNLPVIALSQLSRAVEQREDKKPQLSDLRESGTIEQDADVVMFIYREEYYESRKMPINSDSEAHTKWQARMESIHNQAEILILKQRHGPTGTIQLHYDGKLMLFSDGPPSAGKDSEMQEMH